MVGGDKVSEWPTVVIDTEDETDGRLTRIEEKVDALDAKLTAVLASVNEIVDQAKPALEQVMNSPILAMLTGTGGKKNGR